MKTLLLCTLLSLLIVDRTAAQGDGYIYKDGKRQFVFGSYFLPKSDADLKEMTEAGFSLFACGSKEDLDRVQRYNAQGWVFLPLQRGVTPDLKQKIMDFAGHPALAVWSGPDELVWGFTANSRLYRELKVHSVPGAWRKQTPDALVYARQQSEIIMPQLHNAINYLRSVDKRNLQLWFNEGENSDMGYVGQYMDDIDITGFDLYPVKTAHTDSSTTRPRRQIQRIGKSTERWTAISKGKPLWIVLQAFSWSELLKIEPWNAAGRALAYPSFEESRYMAYDVLANGATGILYWGMRFLTSEECRQSLYGLAREFKVLQPFLSTEPKPLPVTTYEPPADANGHVLATAHQYGRDWMITVVNEADTTQSAAVISGLDHLNGQKLVELYGDDEVQVKDGKLFTRLRPLQVKVFATSRKWETSNKKGRDYQGK